MERPVAAAAVHESNITIEATGKPVVVPRNLVSKSLYKYHCIRCTSLGAQILGASISANTRKYIKISEKFDHFMHYFGCPIILIMIMAVPSVKPVGHTQPGAATALWIVAWFLFLMHLANLAWAFAFFVVPLNRAKNLALMCPTKNQETINGSRNEFITITSLERSTYALTDFQAAIFAQATVRGEIKLMLYNKYWSVIHNHAVGDLNVYVHFIPFLFLTGAPHSLGFLVLIYVLYFLFWAVVVHSSRVSEPACCDCVFWAPCLPLMLCAPLERTVVARIQDGKAEEGEALECIPGNCYTRYW